LGKKEPPKIKEREGFASFSDKYEKKGGKKKKRK